MILDFKYVRRALARLCFGVVIVTALQAGAAVAADCKLTNRDMAESVQLGIRNGTERHLSVRFYRGAVTDDQLKKTIVVKPGKREQYNYGISSSKEDVRPIARIALGGTDMMECYVVIQNNYETVGSKVKKSSDWQEGGCTLLVAEPCPNCTASCEKSYNPAMGKRRWRTTFKITE